ncbi:MAG: hypothetical protein RR482_02625, partial [Clostridia bacterium]
MKNQTKIGLTSAGICLFLLLLRTASEQVFERFDWIALVLTGMALVGLWLPEWRGERSPQNKPEEAHTLPTCLPVAQWEALKARVAQADWPCEQGGMYDALAALGREKPTEAAYAARGMLALLLHQAVPNAHGNEAAFALAQAGRIGQEDAVTLAQLLDALDGCVQAEEDTSSF